MQEKSNRGRKGKYDTHVKPRLDTIKAWRRRGDTEKDICKKLCVSTDRLISYKKKYPELLEVLKEGLDDAIGQVENALFKRAVGFNAIETKTEDDGERIKITKTDKHYIPDVMAQLAFLNRRAGWRNTGTSDADAGNLKDLFKAIHDSEKPESKPTTETDGEQ